MLSRPRANRAVPLTFLPDPKAWFARLMQGPGIKEARFSHDIGVEASWLPGAFHGDTGDRLIVATARVLNLPILTCDSKILAYAEAGHVTGIGC